MTRARKVTLIGAVRRVWSPFIVCCGCDRSLFGRRALVYRAFRFTGAPVVWLYECAPTCDARAVS